MNTYGFKTDSANNGSALRFCRPGVAITPEGQSSDMRQSSREAARNGFWWRCVTLPLIAHPVRGGDDLQESAPQNRRTP